MASLSVGDAPFRAMALIIALALSGWKITTLIIARRKKSLRPISPVPSEKSIGLTDENAYNDIEPLVDFEWSTTEPIKIRPFKPKYHLTMAIENLPISSLIEMDKTYHDRVQHRAELIRNEGDAVCKANPCVTPAVAEFYEWVFGVYLPRRFPTVWRKLEAGKVRNSVTKREIDLRAPEDPEEALKIMGTEVDCDFLFLMPSDKAEDEGRYRLRGFITCFPSGFDTREKFNRLMSEIHVPVPGYKQRLEKSMDRFFATVPVGKVVKRHNWSITTNPALFTLGGNHMYETTEEGRRREIEKQKDAVDPEIAVLRCERQTVHRLPMSKAMLFAFKTYTYPLREIREEGLGPELATAIDGLGEGNVPDMKVYKRQVVWGDKVKEFLLRK